MIGVDWGTSSFRAFRLAQDGTILARRAAPRGIMTVESGAFDTVLREQIGDWLADGENRILLAGMVGSRQGWVEAPYLPCPASPADIAAALTRVPFHGAQVLLVPGLTGTDSADVPEVLRGEETQLCGVLENLGADAIACLPGTHSKWARLAGGSITGFQTYMSGEVFAALRAGTILGRMMKDGPTDLEAFERGIARAADPGHLLHQLFGVRTLGLFGKLSDTQSASYLSGLLIGHEIRDALSHGTADTDVHLIGAAPLCELYARAIAACGGRSVIAGEDSGVRGLALIGRKAAWA
jgi:2-dehydro-3-deoxygalactonokinase